MAEEATEAVELEMKSAAQTAQDKQVGQEAAIAKTNAALGRYRMAAHFQAFSQPFWSRRRVRPTYLRTVIIVHD